MEQHDYYSFLSSAEQSVMGEKSPKIITFYAEKGGVGKTTICLSLAYTFAKAGKRVIIYDCDVQRSLTAWAFGGRLNTGDLSFERPDDGFKSTLYEQINDNEQNVSPAFAIYLTENVYIVPGDRNLPKLDTTIVNAESMSAFTGFGLTFPNQKSGRAYYALMETAKRYRADYVFLDLNPYPGVLNRCLIMSSHYIIIPTCLDYFCLEMMHMMQKNLKNWDEKIKNIEEATKRPGAWFPWPNHRPKFLGYITNMVMMYNNNKKLNELNELNRNVKMRNNMEYFQNMIQKEAENLTSKLQDLSMSISPQHYTECGGGVTTQMLGEITEFHGLADISNLFHTPVPFLQEDQFVMRRRNPNNTNKNDLFEKLRKEELKVKTQQVERFRVMFEKIMQRIEQIIRCDDQLN